MKSVFSDRPYLRYPVVVGLAVAVLALELWLLPPAALSVPGLAACLLPIVLIALIAREWYRMTVRWDGTLSSIGDGLVMIDRSGCVKFMNPAAETMTGWLVREARKKRLDEVVNLVDEKTGKPLESQLNKLLKDGIPYRGTRPKILVSRDGHEVWVEESSTPIRSQKGAIIGATLVLRDVTARREIQDQVNQSQKMDAVGRLASGVAGDFNDLLTVITGYGEMIRSDLDPTDHRWRFADEICTAAERAAGLTRQLTALGNKEPGPMRVQELHALIASLEPVLKRLLGDRIDLVIVPGNGRVKVDAAQIEQVIVNLAMNSRDAMPNGGKFVIEISGMELAPGQTDPWPGLKPGSYVTLAVSDTGSGMDAETRAHLFEPFFTTKSRGKGAGLGLSVVYGIIQQCGGFINVYSQLGSGTIIEIFLPKEKGSAEIVLPQSRRSKRGSETVLIVDDEEGIRKLVHSVLAANGYKVLEARDGAEALSIFEANQDRVKIVVTDVVMPTMTGVDLGDRLHRMNPALRILYMSGFRDTPLGIASPEADKAFLRKPFTPFAFLTAVRELLDGVSAEQFPGAQQ